MKTLDLDSEERQILADFEAGQFVSAPDLAIERAKLEESAKAALKPGKALSSDRGINPPEKH